MGKVSYWDLGLAAFRSDWLVRRPQRSLVSVSPSLELQTCTAMAGFYVDSMYWTQVLMPVWQVLISMLLLWLVLWVTLNTTPSILNTMGPIPCSLGGNFLFVILPIWHWLLGRPLYPVILWSASFLISSSSYCLLPRTVSALTEELSHLRHHVARITGVNFFLHLEPSENP